MYGTLGTWVRYMGTVRVRYGCGTWVRYIGNIGMVHGSVRRYDGYGQEVEATLGHGMGSKTW